MEHIMSRSHVKEVAVEGALCLLAVAAFPILALLGFALRGAVLLAFVLAALLCALLYPASRRFREWFKTQADIEFRHRGLRLARDVLLYPAHSWARWGKKSVTVGADDLLLSAVGPVESIELPTQGVHAERGEPLFRVCRGERCVDVLSPISGFVCESNEVLKHYPELMNDLPFSQGWAVRMCPDDADRERRSLLGTRRARTWFESEVDRAIRSAAADDSAENGRLYRHIDRASWNCICEMFKQRPAESGSTLPAAS